ncbi:RidA family protein [Streptomyces sp. NPDC005970]|uniref:RidA family protein n=1 Tax=Streptomyces sp. NPDC005970 TaxID=3156723 RepID=UPI00340EFC5F
MSGGLVFTSGQGPLDPATNEMPADFAAQATRVLSNLVAVFEAAGSSKDRLAEV